MILAMTAVMHIIDRAAPQDMLDQLSLLAGAGETVICAGPPPEAGRFRLSVTAVHRPIGPAGPYGLRLAGVCERAQLVHVWSLGALPLGRVAALSRGCPLVLSLPHAPEPKELRRLIPAMSKNPFTVTTATESARRRLVEAGAPDTAVHVLPPPAASIEQAGEKRRSVREELGIRSEDVLIVAPAPMTLYAGHKYASWAHAIVREILPNVRLLMPGGGPVWRHVRNFAGTTGFDPDIFLTGYRYSRPEALAAADVAVLFFERDCGTAALAAAMAAGLPIAASNTPDVAEICPPDQTGLLITPKDPRAAAAAVLKLIEQPELARRLGRAARTRAGRNFDPAQCRGALDHIYRQAHQPDAAAH